MVNNGTLVESDKWELWKKVKGAPFCLIKSVFNVKTFKFHLRTTRRDFCSRVNKFTLLAQGKFYFSHFSRLRSHSLGTLFFFSFRLVFFGAQSLLAEVQFHHHRICSHDLSWTVLASRASQQRNFIMNFFLQISNLDVMCNMLAPCRSCFSFLIRRWVFFFGWTAFFVVIGSTTHVPPKKKTRPATARRVKRLKRK